jgi:prepilin-type N-terminal cleavage/methylation domain-containing protein
VFRSVQQRSGYTLVELLLGMSLVALLIALASVALSDLYYKSKIRSFQNRLSSAIQRARIVAMLQQQNIVLSPISNDWNKGFQICKSGHKLDVCEGGESLYIQQSSLRASVKWRGFQNSNYLLFHRSPAHMAVNGVFYISKGRYSARIRVNKLGLSTIEPIEYVNA